MNKNVKIAKELIKIAKTLVSGINDRRNWKEYLIENLPLVNSIGSKIFKKAKIKYVQGTHSYEFIADTDSKIKYNLIIFMKYGNKGNEVNWHWYCSVLYGEKLISQSIITNTLQDCIKDLKKNIQKIDYIVATDYENKLRKLNEPNIEKELQELEKKMDSYNFTSGIDKPGDFIMKQKEYKNIKEEKFNEGLATICSGNENNDYLLSFYGYGMDKTKGRIFSNESELREAFDTVKEYLKLKKMIEMYK